MPDAFTAPLAQTETLGLPAKPWSRRAIGGSYNPDAAPSSGFTPLPAGEYTLEICESEYAPNLGGTGMVLACRAQIVGGQYDGQPYYLNYNLEDQNETAQEIGQRDFAGLRRATGVLNPQSTGELHFIPFRVGVTLQHSKDTGELENVIKQYLFDDAPIAA
ncbi:DUF669 domain-containing protein [Bosea sp. (in: a-proteobacteria)]|uniref:DUF669 domain-containing protein n=1 Tax=Bosea sp. (in: a-proteobacteria) TaxID=1871050 RepID=UPI001AC12796|nr:DUF669 domain-containing protein [Bosea sp. (in: a-proteobacteria)]MBN9440674.1 DUF669 domain-containing protein [Bosea sp. (in: a-proteobacteria)]